MRRKKPLPPVATPAPALPATSAAIGLPVNVSVDPAPAQEAPVILGQAIPLDQISRNGKFEGQAFVALIALITAGLRSLLSAERDLIEEYRRIGEALWELRQHPDYGGYGNWQKFCEGQGWDFKRVGKCLAIFKAGVLDAKTVDEALGYRKHAKSPQCGTTYILNDGRTVFFGIDHGHYYVWDGTAIEERNLGPDDVVCVSLVELDPPTQGQLWKIYEKTLPTVEEAARYAAECLEEAKPEPDEAKSKPNLRVVGNNSPAPAKEKPKTKPKPKRKGKRKTLADNDSTAGQHRWNVHYCLMGTIMVFADSEDEAEDIVANANPDHWDNLFSFDNLNNVMVDVVEPADEEPEAQPEPAKRKGKKKAGLAS
jgi:hypothetical protein